MLAHVLSRRTVVDIHAVRAGKVRTGGIAAADFKLLRMPL